MLRGFSRRDLQKHSMVAHRSKSIDPLISRLIMRAASLTRVTLTTVWERFVPIQNPVFCQDGEQFFHGHGA